MEAARTVKDVSPYEFVKAYSAHLKRSGKIRSPALSLYPLASMARKIYLRQGIGVGGFQKIYGGRKRNCSCPPHCAVARNILQQLQGMNIIDVDTKGGRMITSQGRRDLDQVAGRITVEP